MNSKMGSSSQAYMNQQNIISTPQGPVGILWDIENCSVPSDVRPEDVAGNIRMALRAHPILQGAAVTLFSAYGDFTAFPTRLREGCQRTGVKLVDVPNGRKDAADKAILVDMFLFALDNPPPSSIMLISGDVDFSPALHILGQRGYNVILVIPAGVGVSSALSNAGRFLWDWPSVARGEGFVSPRTLMSRGSTNVAECLRGCQINRNSYNQNDDAFQRSTNQSGDIIGLKGQLVKLLELSGGCLPLACVFAQFKKIFGRPFYVAEYGVSTLVTLLNKMADTMMVKGKYVYLRNGKQFKQETQELLVNSCRIHSYRYSPYRGYGGAGIGKNGSVYHYGSG
ncbi:hypothetical protein MKW94_005896 [Papaver nudicaule]|uniref:HTH OST-type domain-containing protein n=1 Tax=Papaver nudicaule TaxID=74823 RepID=A0AA41SKZ9_PAPNU|nr:hypothetical protein [Papaver nudicaule]